MQKYALTNRCQNSLKVLKRINILIPDWYIRQEKTCNCIFVVSLVITNISSNNFFSCIITGITLRYIGGRLIRFKRNWHTSISSVVNFEISKRTKLEKKARHLQINAPSLEFLFYFEMFIELLILHKKYNIILL